MFVNKNSAREQRLQKITKMDHDQRTSKKKDDISNTTPPQDNISRHQPKLNSVHFEYPYKYIKHMDNIHEEVHLIVTQEQNI